jgi:RNA polymerase sigma factor (sigma-70 family)
MLKELGKRKNEVSLNTPVMLEEECELQDLISDPKQSFDGVELRFELEDFYKTLTPRRQEVLKRKADGQTRKEIAHALGVSEDTIERETKKIKHQWKVFRNNVEEEE